MTPFKPAFCPILKQLKEGHLPNEGYYYKETIWALLFPIQNVDNVTLYGDQRRYPNRWYLARSTATLYILIWPFISVNVPITWRSSAAHHITIIGKNNFKNGRVWKLKRKRGSLSVCKISVWHDWLHHWVTSLH